MASRRSDNRAVAASIGRRQPRDPVVNPGTPTPGTPKPPFPGDEGGKRHPFRIRIYRNMMLDSTVVCRRALGCEWGGKTHTALGPESGTRGMRGSKPAGFTGVGERAARSLDRVSRRRGPRRAAGASLEQRDLLDDVCRVREHSRGHDAGEVVGEVVRRVEAAVGGAVAPALPA